MRHWKPLNFDMGHHFLQIVYHFWLNLIETLKVKIRNEWIKWPNFNYDTIFGNYMILKNIVQHLPRDSLLPLRLVNSEWHSLCTEELIRRRQNEIHFKYSTGLSTFVLTNRSGRYVVSVRKRSLWRLDDLTNFLIKCSNSTLKFPCSAFTFKMGDLNCNSSIKFFSLYGHKIKRLTLILTMEHYYPVQMIPQALPHVPTEIWTLGLILSTRVPNLEFLSLSKFPIHWQLNHFDLFPEPVNFKLWHLKSLDIGNFFLFHQKVVGVLIEIIKVSPSLKLVTFADHQCADFMRKSLTDQSYEHVKVQSSDFGLDQNFEPFDLMLEVKRRFIRWCQSSTLTIIILPLWLIFMQFGIMTVIFGYFWLFLIFLTTMLGLLAQLLLLMWTYLVLVIGNFFVAKLNLIIAPTN